MSPAFKFLTMVPCFAWEWHADAEPNYIVSAVLSEQSNVKVVALQGYVDLHAFV